MKERHGIPSSFDIKMIALHEAGHLLMLWLLDRHAVACIVTDGGGLTQALDEPGAKETPHQRILYAMSGMVLAGDIDLLNDLRQHASQPDYFDPISDSHYAAEALPLVGGDPAMVVSQFQHIILRFGAQFGKAHRQATKLLMNKHAIAFDTILDLFSQWDIAYRLVNRPKSDVVCRTIARAFRWPMPQGKLFGWDFKPMADDYVVSARIGRMQLAEILRSKK